MVAGPGRHRLVRKPAIAAPWRAGGGGSRDRSCPRREQPAALPRWAERRVSEVTEHQRRDSCEAAERAGDELVGEACGRVTRVEVVVEQLGEPVDLRPMFEGQRREFLELLGEL